MKGPSRVSDKRTFYRQDSDRLRFCSIVSLKRYHIKSASIWYFVHVCVMITFLWELSCHPSAKRNTENPFRCLQQNSFLITFRVENRPRLHWQWVICERWDPPLSWNFNTKLLSIFSKLKLESHWESFLKVKLTDCQFSCECLTYCRKGEAIESCCDQMGVNIVLVGSPQDERLSQE